MKYFTRLVLLMMITSSWGDSLLAQNQYAPLKVTNVIDPRWARNESESWPHVLLDQEENVYAVSSDDYLTFTKYTSSDHTTAAWEYSIGTNGGNERWTYPLQAKNGNINFIGQYSGSGHLQGKLVSAADELIWFQFTPTGTLVFAKVLTKRMNNSGSFLAHASATDSQGNIYVTSEPYGGHTQDYDPGAGELLFTDKIVLSKYAADGTFVWAKAFPAPMKNNAKQLKIFNDKIYIAEDYNGTINVNMNGTTTLTGSYDYFIARYDLNGNFERVYNIGNVNEYDGIGDFSVDAQGNVLVAASFRNSIDLDLTQNEFILTAPKDKRGVYIASYGADGAFKSGFKISDGSEAFIKSMVKGSDGSYYMGGGFYAFEALTFYGKNNADIVVPRTGAHNSFFIKYDPGLSIDYAQVFRTGQNNFPTSIFLLPNNRLALFGNYNGTVDFDFTQGEYNLTGQSYGQVYGAFYCTVLKQPVASHAWPTYIKQGSTGIKLSINAVAGASGYTWKLPDGFTITVGAGTTTITVTASATAVSGNIEVTADNGCGAGLPLVHAVTTGTKSNATITQPDITKLYGDAPFKLNATTNASTAITYQEFSDPQNAISISGNIVTVMNTGTVKMIAKVPGDATYGDGLKEFTITVNKRPIVAQAKSYTREKDIANPPLGIIYRAAANSPVGNALHFDGNNDIVEAPYHANLSSIDNELTVEAWVNLKNPSLNQKIIGNYELNNSGFLLGIDNGKIYPEVGVQDRGNLSLRGGMIEADTWTHLAFTYKAGDKLTAYVNGEKVAEVAGAGAIIDNTGTLSIGGRFGYIANMKIDEVRIWNKVRTPEQIEDYMNTAVPYTSEGLIAYYNFDQGFANENNTGEFKLKDAKGNDGSLTNFLLSGTTSNWVEGALPYNASGFKADEDESVLNTKPVATTTADINSLPGNYDINVSGGADDHYTFIYETGLLTINKVEAAITLANLQMVYNGNAQEPTITTDPASLPFIITYNGNSEKPVNAGTYAVEILIDDDVYQGSISDEFIITKATQQINVQQIDDKLIDTAPFVVEADATSGLPVTLSTTTPDKISIDGNTITILEAGTAVLTLSQEGNDNYLAEDVNVSFCILPQVPTITEITPVNGDLVLQSSSDVNNQWMLDGVDIEGETSQTLEVKAPGSYTVKVLADECFSTSAAFEVIITGIEKDAHQYALYPNPVNDVLNIQNISHSSILKEISIYNNQGTYILTVKGTDITTLDLSTFQSGIYLLVLKEGSSERRYKFIKK